MNTLDELVALLDLEPLEVNLFRGVSWKDDRPRVFGGQVAGQALVAAGRTVDGRGVHSLHAYFLRPGDPSVPIVYEVDRIRDGKSFTTRRVVAIQHGEAIFNLQASFHVDEPGLLVEAARAHVLVGHRLPGHRVLVLTGRGKPGDDRHLQVLEHPDIAPGAFIALFPTSARPPDEVASQTFQPWSRAAVLLRQVFLPQVAGLEDVVVNGNELRRGHIGSNV